MSSLQEVLRECDEKMKKTIDIVHKDFAGIRTGKASPVLVDNVMVDYYGTPTPIKSLAGVSIPEPRMMVIAPWDPSSLQAISKAIISANIGINPVIDGKAIRLPVPDLSEERRKELIKIIKKKAINLGMAGSPICLSLYRARLPSGVTEAFSERIVAMARLCHSLCETALL